MMGRSGPDMLRALRFSVCILLCVNTVLADVLVDESYSILNTTLGTLTGTVSVINGTQINRYMGIPYAKPPVAELRFAKPQTYGHFGKINATKFGSSCVQNYGSGTIGDEDCLFLNVFAPAQSHNKSVMVWIHGGSFLSGSSSDHPADALAALNDVVVVTINYRLNIFGFLTTGDRVLPGNLGLWDQHLALKWVSDNIADYGGNRESATIFGESAGGRSVVFQMFTPQNDASIFQRAIAESGSALSFTYLNRNPYEVTNHVSKTTNCSITSHFVQCLRTKPVSILSRATRGISRPFAFFPIVDNDFLSHDLGYMLKNFTTRGPIPEVLQQVANFNQYDLLAGFNDQEGIIYMGTLNGSNNRIDGENNLDNGVSEHVLTHTLKQYPFYKYPKSMEAQNLTIEIFKKFYHTNPVSPLKEGRSQSDGRVVDFMNIAGDVVLKLPVVQTLQLHTALSNKSTYGYEFSHKRSWKAPWYEGPDWLRTGAVHTDEIPYVYGYPFLLDNVQESDLVYDKKYISRVLSNMQFTSEEKIFSQRIMSYWTDFAKFGNPGNDFAKFSFPQNQSYALLTQNETTIHTYPLNDQQRLWSTIDAAIIELDEQEPEGKSGDMDTSEKKYLSGLLNLTDVELDIWLTALFSLTIIFAAFCLIFLVCICRLTYVIRKSK